MEKEKIIEACLSVYPELGLRWPRSYLLNEVRLALVETAAFCVASGVAPSRKGLSTVREALQEELGPYLKEVADMRASEKKDIAAIATCTDKKALQEIMKTDGRATVRKAAKDRHNKISEGL